jgi:hypothetical protein
MEFKWKLNWSGAFPNGIWNAIASLHAVLVIQEAEASQETTYKTTTATIPTPATTSTPANTAAPTTTTVNSSTTASTETTTVAMAVTVKLHETTQDDSKEHKGSEEMRRDEIGEWNNGQENNNGEECETPKDGNSETHTHGNKQRELEDGKCGIYECEGSESYKSKQEEWESLPGLHAYYHWEEEKDWVDSSLVPLQDVCSLITSVRMCTYIHKI